MNKDYSLEEKEVHGTKQQPIRYMHFITGEGTIYPENFFVQRHWHHSCEILHIIKGNFMVELDLESYGLSEGDICMVGSGELHLLEGMEPDTIHEVIIFDPHILEFSYADQFQEEVVAPLLRYEYAMPHTIRLGEPGYNEIIRIYEKIIKEHDNWYFEAKLGLLTIMNELKRKNLFLKTAHIHNETEKLKIDRYKKIISYMQDNFANRITLEDLSGIVDCNSQYLCHFFKDIAGVPPMQYLIGYRITQAQNMLKYTTKSVLEISMDCGFDNVSYFIRQFKRITGVTPRQYREI